MPLAIKTILLVCFLLYVEFCIADGPKDNVDSQVRRIPPVGFELDAGIRDELMKSVTELEKQVPPFPRNRNSIDWWNDVAVICRGVRLTIEEGQFYKEVEIDQSRKLIKLAAERAQELKSHAHEADYRPTWSKQAGRIIAGHRSDLDDSVQPFSVFIPDSVAADPAKPRRLDIWLHGRDESVSEVTFLYRRLTQDSQYQPADTLVLQPWGRYSNAFRFAGEVDVFEALAEVQKRYAIDPNRIVIRGFSMGGAGCWHLAVHHADRFCAANPGAGFCETQRFLSGFQGETLNPSKVQRALWNLHDCPPVVLNLTNLPTVAYSGGQDKQKEAADMMVAVAREAGLEIPYVIHPESAHVIHPDSKIEIESKIAAYAKAGRDPLPKHVSWSTFSLRNSRAYWLQLRQLEKHWTLAKVDAKLNDDFSELTIHAENVVGLEIKIPANQAIAPRLKSIKVSINGSNVGELPIAMDRSISGYFQRGRNEWKLQSVPENSPGRPELAKRVGLHGPIDDAFLSRFIIVKPTGKSRFSQVDVWCERELQHAVQHWRQQFRGTALVKSDIDITPQDEAECNLVCFGTPQSNSYIRKCLKALPLKWNDDKLSIGDESLDSSKAIPALIYPNPNSSERYIVLNSGFTYREYDYLNNARQTPKLGDWAIFDLASPMTTRAAGAIIAEGFFDEEWRP
jgi:Prolyl oligopeptidase family